MEVTSLVFSIIAVVVSILAMILSIVQNRKLHNENQKLSIEPDINIDLLFDSKIGGQLIKKEYAIDSYTVWESKYTKYYVNNEVEIDKCKQALFTIFIKNTGNGVANAISLENIEIKTKNETKIFDKKVIIFNSCNSGEELANKIYIDIDPNEIMSVKLKVSYFNLMKNKINYTYNYVTDKPNKEMLRFIGKNENEIQI